MITSPATLEVHAVGGIGEIQVGDDLAAVLLEHLSAPLRRGDVVVVTSKVVSKSAGLVVHGSRDDLLASQTDRVVARRGRTRIVRTHHGLTMAAAGIDASNAPAGTAVPLPPEPDADARRLRARIARLAGVDVAVVVTDTSGRAWRTGQTDIAIGAAGITPEDPMDGRQDSFGNPLAVTSPAVADEVAAAADLVKGKLSGCPIAIVRGLADQWLTADDGPGAAALVRPEAADLFGLGAVDAVRAAVRRDEQPVRGFPAPDVDALESILRDAMHGRDDAVVHVEAGAGNSVEVVRSDDSAATWIETGVVLERLRTLTAASRIELDCTVR